MPGALAPGHQPPPPTGITTIHALHFRAFSTAGYKGDFSRVRAGHALATLGKHITPLLTATLSPQTARPIDLPAQFRAR